MLWVCDELGVGYDAIKSGGSLGEEGAELNSDERSVKVLQSDSLSAMSERQTIPLDKQDFEEILPNHK